MQKFLQKKHVLSKIGNGQIDGFKLGFRDTGKKSLLIYINLIYIKDGTVGQPKWNRRKRWQKYKG